MACDNSRPFPREVVRDLLGIVRGLYRAAQAEGPQSSHNLETLERIGTELALALDLGRNERGSLGARAAWDRAERATAMLGSFIADTTPIAPAIRATMARVRRH